MWACQFMAGAGAYAVWFAIDVVGEWRASQFVGWGWGLVWACVGTDTAHLTSEEHSHFVTSPRRPLDGPGAAYPARFLSTRTLTHKPPGSSPLAAYGRTQSADTFLLPPPSSCVL